MVKIELRKWNTADYFKFLRLTLDKTYFGEFSNSFFGYLLRGLKSLVRGEKDYKFAILVNGKIAGSVALYRNKRDYELGCFILREFRDKGIATKASQKILNLGFKRLKLKRVIATTDIDAKFSKKILRKLGFKLIKENKKDKELLWEKRK